LKKGTIILIAVIAVIVLLVSWVVGSYNGMMALREETRTAWSGIENNLQRRSDLIPNLVETVKGYAEHETEIFTAVADARSKLIGAGSTAESAEANDELSGALSRLLAISESYPELKADQNFRQLQDELAGTENRIARSREEYNTTAASYNKRVQAFPAVIFAGMLGFERADYFEAAAGASEVPNVSF